ncbi:T9SS type A sorting domain-containing protein [Flectobacillus roseus]|uniref:T9SS type A sorting domain-containing protein n=1 Tax=Flectobacillus roseus TaxID=502259 RepID=UPI0024B7AFF2|nr:T9SS type A sorting domain-containing protein [Flectobacillus roseus]MDI9872525.1 sialate O-acetylesterase [Flectobacillus roseus]
MAGDFYVVNGQSNAYAFNIGNEPYYESNPYIRTFGINMGKDSDTLWTSPSPQVGAWALALQKYIIQNTGIPTCVINGAVPGTSIALHFRDNQNPTNLGTIYGSLLYRIQKAKATNYIRAFIWAQGENDTFEHSTTYPDDFRKLYQSWQIDFPKVEQYIVFQNNVLPLPTLTGASIRNFQRMTPSLFSKTEVFSQIGIETIDGIHHSNQGYFRIASELYKILAPKFYGAQDDPNNHSPNVKRAYFTNSQHTAIALEFPVGTTMIAVPDTIIKSPATGNTVTLGIKDYIYFDNDETKVSTISDISYQGNKVILTFTNPISYSKIDYLPARYYTFDFQKFMGPCLRSKNYVNACSFYDLAIDHENTSPITNPTLGAQVIYYNQGKLYWNQVDRATSTVLEVDQAEGYHVITTLDASVTVWNLSNLLPNTVYKYRIKAISATATSDYVYVTLTTPAMLVTPKLEGSQVAISQNRVTWNDILGTSKYVLERATGLGVFEKVGEFASNVTSYVDGVIKLGNSYTYRLKAYGVLTESEAAVVAILVKNELSVPTISLTSVYSFANGVSVVSLSWKAITGATNYSLERKQSDKAYQIITNLDNSQTSYKEQNLLPATTYVYRIKAIGVLTESKYDSIIVLTPNVLATPNLTVDENLGNKTLSIRWNAIAGATSYQLTRTIAGSTESLKANVSATSMIDSAFVQKANYTYTVQAFGINTESAIATKTFVTSLILANEPLAVESLVYPNPCSEFMSIRLPYVTSGKVEIIDIQGSILKTIDFKNQELLELSVQNLPAGMYITRVQTTKANWVTKMKVVH